MMLRPSLLLLVTSIVYCLVNALVLGYLLNRYSKLKRFSLFFNKTFIDSVISLIILIGIGAFFVVYHCQISRLSHRIFGLGTERCPQADLLYLVLTASFAITMVMGLLALFIQFFFLRNHYDIDDELLLIYLLISNGLASCVKYLLIAG